MAKMSTTGTMAKALRKNTTWPTGVVSPSARTPADITANTSADATLKRIPLRTDIGA